MKIEETADGCIVDVSVKPRSNTFRVVAEGEDLFVFCTEEPVKGRVNKELVKELTRFFHKPVEFVSGYASREKRFFIKGISKSGVEALLGKC